MDQKLGRNLVYIENTLYEGYVLSKVESGSSRENNYLKKNLHYCFVNRRPVDPLPLLVSTLNEVYKKYNHGTKYVFVINFKF